MDCPNCGKLLSKKINHVEEDGGITFEFNCDKCKHIFTTFITQFDLEEKYEGTETFA